MVQTILISSPKVLEIIGTKTSGILVGYSDNSKTRTWKTHTLRTIQSEIRNWASLGDAKSTCIPHAGATPALSHRFKILVYYYYFVLGVLALVNRAPTIHNSQKQIQVFPATKQACA